MINLMGEAGENLCDIPSFNNPPIILLPSNDLFIPIFPNFLSYEMERKREVGGVGGEGNIEKWIYWSMEKTKICNQKKEQTTK